jgi:hypothetical protein
LPGRPSTPRTPVGRAIMERAGGFGYPTTDTLAAAAGLSNRTVWALVTGERPDFGDETCARLEECLLLEPGCLRVALKARSPHRLRFAAGGDSRREAHRRDLAALLASAGIPRDPGRLRSGASRLRAAAPPRDAEMADLAALAELVAAVIDGTEFTRDEFSERLRSRTGLTRKDRQEISARAPRAPRGQDSGSAIPQVVFQAEG